jgi:hypothetical protein
MGLIEVVQDINKFNWIGIPYCKRFSDKSPPAWLVKRMREYDDLLDLKWYIPNLEWQVVRFIGSRESGKWTTVWSCVDDPARGLKAELGDWIIGALRIGDTWNENKDFIDNIEKNEEELAKSKDAELSDMSLELAKDLRKPMQRLYDYGPDQPYDNVWQNPGLKPINDSTVPSVESKEPSKTS